MDTTARQPGGAGWTEVDACTLPNADRPLRRAEFDALFASALRAVEPSGPTGVRLLLGKDATSPEQVQRLADAESSCCSFFSFAVSTTPCGSVALDIEVPPAYVDVLAGLVARARTVRAERVRAEAS